jgi:hypothetical protein
MKTSWTILLALVAWMAMGCSTDDPGEGTDTTETVDFTLEFQGVFGDQPLRMFEGTYDYPGGVDLRFQLFQFYLSDIGLLTSKNGQTDTTFISDIALVSFKDIITAEDAAKGVSITLSDVPAGTYDGLVMGIGVAPKYNATQPGDYTPPHPLDDHYWSWARGYVFAKVEGNADLDGDGTFEEKLTYHLGENDFYRPVVLNETLVVGPSNQHIDFRVDAERMLSDGEGNYVDFRQVTQDHTNDLDLVGFMMDNLVKAVSMTVN